MVYFFDDDDDMEYQERRMDRLCAEIDKVFFKNILPKMRTSDDPATVELVQKYDRKETGEYELMVHHFGGTQAYNDFATMMMIDIDADERW